MKQYLSDLNTTAFRIVVSVVLAFVGVLMVLAAILWRNWLPTSEQTRVLAGLAAVVLTMMGFDVLQFASKRFSDTGYAAAKASGAPPVTVEAPSTVTVTAPSVSGLPVDQQANGAVPDLPHIPNIPITGGVGGPTP